MFQDGSLQVVREWMAKVFPTWMELLEGQANSILMLPHYTQHEILHQVNLMACRQPSNYHIH